MSGARNDSPRRITLPMSEAEARSLHAGEMVLVDGECTITAGIPTMDRMLRCLDDGQPFPIDLDGGSITHVGSLSRDTPDGLELLYMNPTTSTRFNPDMPRLIRELRLHAVGGKGGLDAESRIAMQEVGCVYLGLLGGGSVLLSDAVTDVVSVHWVDLVPHYRLVAIKVRDLGPLAAAVDAHGNSIYKQLADNAREWAAGILVALAHQRGSS